jgi:crotonobetainyl-CoA:carnitine CoA-transferase CaiB-like acyl-CoA transferase
MKALENIVVLDLTHMVAGPYATQLLADMGAVTIKVEPPGTGEATRKLLANSPDYSVDGIGAYFLTLNRNKRSICIDLKSPDGLALMYRLVRHADVVIDNFSAGVTSRLMIDHERLSEVNPRLVTCSITGFGGTGDAANRPAFDMVAQGMGGGMSITGERNGRPIRPGTPYADLTSGMFASLGILAAIHARGLTGRGQHVDISMLDSQISLLTYMATMHLLSGKIPGREGNGHIVHVPYDSFCTRSRDLIIAIITDNFWLALLEVLDDPELRDPRFHRQPARQNNRDFINERVQAVLLTETCEHWLDKLAEARIPSAPVNDFAHALTDPQVLARSMVVEVAHPGGHVFKAPGNPIKLSDTHEDSFSPPPLPGADTDVILRNLLAMSGAEITELRERKVIG